MTGIQRTSRSAIHSSLLLLLLFSGAFSPLHGQQALSDSEFDLLVEQIDGYSSRVLEIGYARHPRSLKVLEDLREAISGRPIRWGDFQKVHGYPYSAHPDATVQIQPHTVETAMAAAGDEDSFQRIVEGFDETSDHGRYQIIRRLVLVRNDRAIRYLGSLLQNDEAYALGFPVSVRASEALHELVEADGSESVFRRDPTTANLEAKVVFWRDWWAENASKYGSEDLAIESAPAESRRAEGDSAPLVEGSEAE